MLSLARKLCVVSVIAVCGHGTEVRAVEFEPGVGVGVEYSDNATLAPDDTKEDMIAVGYVGASLSDNDGSLAYDTTASFNKHVYTKDSFPDQRYFNLSANVGWEMIKNRFDWFLNDHYSQRPIVSLNSNTPDNIQDANTFIFGANLRQPVSLRNSFTLTPVYSQYYYETLLTDNRQYALTANWTYQMRRLTSFGLSASARKINYFERFIDNTTFTNAAFVVNGRRKHSTFSLNLGATNVKRDNGGDSTGFSGYMDWLTNLTSISSISTIASTELTDTSSVSTNTGNIPGSSNEVQVTTDVIRNSTATLAYIRDDELTRSRIWLDYRKVTYSDSPLDRVVRGLGATVNYPLSRLLSSGVYANYNRAHQIESDRRDKRIAFGANLKYRFARKLKGFLDIKYRKKESTSVTQNFEEVSVYATLVYGFGDAYRPSRAGGF